MRLARLVAAGLVLGAGAGFLASLLRPRPAPAYDPRAVLNLTARQTRTGSEQRHAEVTLTDGHHDGVEDAVDDSVVTRA